MELIFEYKPYIYSEISDCISEVLESHSNAIKDISDKTYLRFITDDLDKIIEKKGSGWTTSNRILLYEVQNRNDKIVIKLIIGPGDDIIRKKLFDIATQNKNLFKGMIGSLTQNVLRYFQRSCYLKTT